MGNAFVASLSSNFEQALRLLEVAIQDCSDDLWLTDLWPDEAPTAPTPHGGLHGSAPWFLAYHALSTLDFDLADSSEPWTPPPPIEHTYGSPNRAFTQVELLGYLEHCREQVARMLGSLTEDAAARPLPPGHRHHGRSYGTLVGNLPLHAIEHAAQIRQFLTAAGVQVQPVPGDRHYSG